MAKITEERKKIEALKKGASCLFPIEDKVKIYGYVQRANMKAKISGKYKDDTKYSLDSNPKNKEGFIRVVRNY